MDQFFGLELTQEGFELSAAGVVGEGGELEFGGRGVEDADAEGGRRSRGRGVLLRGPRISSAPSSRNERTHLDSHTMTRQIVRQQTAIDDSATSEHALELSAHDRLARRSFGFRSSLLAILDAQLGTEGGLALVDAADFVALGEELVMVGRKKERGRGSAEGKGEGVERYEGFGVE